MMALFYHSFQMRLVFFSFILWVVLVKIVLDSFTSQYILIEGCLDVMNQHYCSYMHELHWAQSPHLTVRSVTCHRKFNTLFVLLQSSETPALLLPPVIQMRALV